MVTWLDDKSFPSRFDDPDELDAFLSRPSRALAADLAAIDGDIIVLGVGGKIGPTLARLARNAAPDKRVIGVARFSDAGLREKLEACGVETIACDLLDRAAVAALPQIRNVIFMAGQEIRRADRSSADLGDQRLCAGDCRRTFSRFADRRLFDRLRLSVRRGRQVEVRARTLRCHLLANTQIPASDASGFSNIFRNATPRRAACSA